MIKSLKSKKGAGFTQHLLWRQKRIVALKPKKSAGFTLVELLVVISIIGILATMSTVSLNMARQKARDAKRKADTATVQLALYLYYDDNLYFPETESMSPDPPEGVANWLDILTPNLNGTETGRTYMARVPLDPMNVDNYVYTYYSDGTEFIISYYLEEGGLVEIHGY